VLSEIVRNAKMDVAPTKVMDMNITSFEDALGGCERILKTPVPLSYTRHTGRFLMIWLTMLPFSLYGSCGIGTIPLCVIIAFLLLGAWAAPLGRDGAGRLRGGMVAAAKPLAHTTSLYTPTPPHLHTSTPPHLHTPTPPHPHTSTPPHPHTSTPTHTPHPHPHTPPPPGIEEIGVSIEEPFSILALEAISDSVRPGVGLNRFQILKSRPI
jgi:hypothetical protein